MIKFPSIEQFRNTNQEIQHYYQFCGKDENGKPIYDKSKPLPTLKFTGTVKLHGTNAAVCWNKTRGIYAQSRNRVLSIENDNSGFCAFVKPIESVFINLMHTLNFDMQSHQTLAVFGEWCGKGIQSNVGIAQLPKMFVVFAAQIVFSDTESRWLTQAELAHFKSPSDQIYNIFDYNTFELDIDFNKVEAYSAMLADITERVERECPVALSHGIEKGTGEGVVWTAIDGEKVWRFKVKGSEHAVSKTKQLAGATPDISPSIALFIEQVLTENRFQQGISEVFTAQNKPVTLSATADFLRWIQTDVLKEESDTMQASNLNEKETIKAIGKASSKWFQTYCAKS